MNVLYNGPFIYISIEANDLSERHLKLPLAYGYSYERIFIHQLRNITELYPNQTVHEGDRITFPPVNCKSPSDLFLSIGDITKYAEIRLSIEKFGQIPDRNYFSGRFSPILVTGEDGNAYKVIPSDQFK